MLEASKAGICQADQDGEQQHQEGEQGEGGLQTWGQRDASLDGGRSHLLHELLCGFSLRPQIKQKTSFHCPLPTASRSWDAVFTPEAQSDALNSCHHPGSISDTVALSQWQEANLLAGMVPSSLQCPGQSRASLLHFLFSQE